MSWSFSFMGKPENIVTAIKARVEKETSPASKEELEKAAPPIIDLVSMNVGQHGSMKVEASGHSYKNGETLVQNCSVKIEPLGSEIV